MIEKSRAAKLDAKYNPFEALLSDLHGVRKKVIQEAVRSLLVERSVWRGVQSGPPAFKLKPPHLQQFRGNKRLTVGSGPDAR
jgi:hypothetical protein